MKKLIDRTFLVFGIIVAILTTIATFIPNGSDLHNSILTFLQ